MERGDADEPEGQQVAAFEVVVEEGGERGSGKKFTRCCMGDTAH